MTVTTIPASSKIISNTNSAYFSLDFPYVSPPSIQEALKMYSFWQKANKLLPESTINLMSQPQWIKDSTGKITGYTTQEGGAGTVFPFSDGLEVVKVGSWIRQKNYTEKYTADKDATYIIFMCCSSLGSNVTYTLSVTSLTANVNTIVNDAEYYGARAAYTVKLNKGESISIYFNTSSVNSYTFSTLIVRN